jgi:hypothetical protein
VQLKEAGPSALLVYSPPRHYDRQALQIIFGQQFRQATKGIFLDQHRSEVSGHDYCWL